MLEPKPPPQPAHVYYERVIYCARCGYGVENEMAKLDYRVYHVTCFYCDQCRSSLVGKQVHIQEGKIYCEECYVVVATKRCDICEHPILGDNEKYIKSKGKMYHTNCYVCSQCGSSLRKTRHSVEGKKRICQTCVNENRRNPSAGSGGGNVFGGPSNGGGSVFGEPSSGESSVFGGPSNEEISEEL